MKEGELCVSNKGEIGWRSGRPLSDISVGLEVQHRGCVHLLPEDAGERQPSDSARSFLPPKDLIHNLCAGRDHWPQLPAVHDLGCPGGGMSDQAADLLNADAVMAHEVRSSHGV